jgi:hypothetical protein
MDRGGKGVVFGIILFFLLVSFSSYFILASAGNTKSYDSATSTATIKNGVTDIAKIKLDTPQVYNVIRGEDRLVAEFTIDNYADASDIFNNMEFYDLKQASKKIDRTFTYRYKVITGTRDIPYYEKVCSIIEYPKNETSDATSREVCENKIKGYNKENVYEWNVLDTKSTLPKGNIIIGIFTDVFVGDYVEWIPTLFGVKINEWAVWTESMNIDLFAYYKLNETSGSFTLDSVFGNNASTVGTPYIVNGIIGKARNFLYSDFSYLTINNTPMISQTFDGYHPLTISYWINQTERISRMHFGQGTSYPSFQMGTTYDGELWFGWYQEPGNAYWVKTTSGASDVWTTNRWTHIVVTYNGTPNITDSVKFYVNGTEITDKTSPFSNINKLQEGRLLNLSIGYGSIDTSTVHHMNGSIDEVGLWNRTLNASEISDLYNGGAGISYVPPSDFDTTPPQTSQPIITPSAPKSNQDLQCNATLTDNMQTNLIAYWEWYKNNVNYLSGNTSVTNGTDSLITTLNAGNVTKGDSWTCEVKSFDGINYGDASNSTPVTILNSVPTQSNPLLKTSSGKNLSTENLTCYNQSTSDADKDVVTNIYNWYKNSQPLTVLNIPFEINADDYSGYRNNGTINGAVFTDGQIGRALSFDGIDDYVDTKDINEAEGINTLTIGAWIKPKTRAIGVVHPMILSKYYAWNLYINGNNNGFVFSFNDGSGWASDTITYSATLSTDMWYHVMVRYDGSTCKIFVNGSEVASGTCNGNITTNTNKVKIGQWNNNEWFNGTIDEVKIYPYALSSEQIKQEYEETKDGLTSNSKIVAEETSGGDDYMCQVTPNDGEEEGDTLNSSTLNVKWEITFNVTDSYSGASLNNVLISCNSTNFNQAGDTTNTYGPYEFESGDYSCGFERTGYYNKNITFNVNADKTINVLISQQAEITIEEHTWLEAIYNCLYLGTCSLYNLLLEINQTTSNIWQQTKPTDNSVITNESIINKIVDSSNNLTINYTVNIPIKAGYSSGTYLPVRMGFWFLNTANTTCYNQGTKPTGVEEPYCQPLIVETLGPMGGNVSFIVKLHPSLPEGNYSIKRIIDIDPNNIWINYGQETIGSFVMKESLSTYGIAIEKTGENNPTVNTNNPQQSSSSSGSDSSSNSKKVTNIYNTYNPVPNKESQTPSEGEVIHLNKLTGITGGIIGTISTLLSGWQITFIITTLCITFIIFILVKYNIIKTKR